MKKFLTISLLVLLTVGLFVSCNADAVETVFGNGTEREDGIIFVPVEVNDGKIVSGEKEVEITKGEDTLTNLSDDQLKTLANKINEIQKNTSVASFKETNLSLSTEINSTGLEAIIAALRTEAEKDSQDSTVKSNIEQKSSSEVDLWVNVELSNIGVEDSETLSISYVEFDVKPMASTTVRNGSGESVTVTTNLTNNLLTLPVRFRLPVDKAISDTNLAVYHEGEFIGYYPVLSASGEKYVEIESKNFSKYGYQLVNENNAGAKIVETGTLYFKFEDAVASVKNNETIKLLKPNSAKEITISKEISFSVDKNDQNYADKIKADTGFKLTKGGTDKVVTYNVETYIAPPTYTVTFSTNGASTVASQTVDEGEKATKPTDPEREYYAFDNWYSDEALKTVYDFNTPVTADITLYAKWNPGLFGFKALEAESKVALVEQGSPTEIDFEYSTDAITWDNYNIGDEITLATVGDKVYFRAKNESSKGEFSKDSQNFYCFSSSSGKLDVFGNVMYLIDLEGKTNISDFALYGLFYGCINLVSAENLILPALSLADYCYYSMFTVCLSLEKAPELPATTLKDSCYGWMFAGCEGLTNAPELPATNLADNCYESMFNYCPNLTNAPELPATELAKSCYGGMFNNCWSLTNAPELPAKTLADNCYGSMFSGCEGLTNVPELPATTLAEGCYENIFDGCTGLTSLPEGLLPATELVAGCYSYMFNGCTGLESLPAGLLPAETMVQQCYEGMFQGCTNLKSLPSGLLPAMTMANSCYYQMFRSCTSLERLPAGLLPATTLEKAEGCYKYMFEGCTKLTEVSELPATKLAGSCYWYMFSNCTSLEKAPELPAKTLAPSCYSLMFSGCSKLKEITMLATDIKASSCLDNWVSGVAETGVFYKAKEIVIGNGINQLNKDSTSGIPEGWTVRKPAYDVTFNLNGITGTTPEAQVIKENGKVSKPTKDLPTLENHTLQWFTKAETTDMSDVWDFDNDKVTADITLYARWTTVISTIVGTNTSVPELESFDWDSPANSFDSIPSNAWVSETGNKAFWVPGDDSFVMIYVDKTTDPIGVIAFGPDDTDTFIKDGNTYVCTNDFGTFTCTMTSGVFTSLKFDGEDFSDGTSIDGNLSLLNGTYNKPAPTINTVADVLATADEPPSTAVKWFGNSSSNPCFLTAGGLLLSFNEQDCVFLTSKVTPSGDNYTCGTDCGSTVTFNMEEGKLQSIAYVKGQNPGCPDLTDTYAPTPK